MASDPGSHSHHRSHKSPAPSGGQAMHHSRWQQSATEVAGTELSSNVRASEQQIGSQPAKYRIVNPSDSNMQHLVCQDLPQGHVQYLSYSTNSAGGLSTSRLVELSGLSQPADLSSRNVVPTYAVAPVGDNNDRQQISQRQQIRDERSGLSMTANNNPSLMVDGSSHSVRVNLISPRQMLSSSSELTSGNLDLQRPATLNNCISAHSLLNNHTTSTTATTTATSAGSQALAKASSSRPATHHIASQQQPVAVVDAGGGTNRRALVSLNGGLLPQPVQYAIIITDPQLQQQQQSDSISNGSNSSRSRRTTHEEGVHGLSNDGNSKAVNHILLSTLLQQHQQQQQQQSESQTILGEKNDDNNHPHHNHSNKNNVVTGASNQVYQVFHQPQRPAANAHKTASSNSTALLATTSSVSIGGPVNGLVLEKSPNKNSNNGSSSNNNSHNSVNSNDFIADKNSNATSFATSLDSAKNDDFQRGLTINTSTSASTSGSKELTSSSSAQKIQLVSSLALPSPVVPSGYTLTSIPSLNFSQGGAKVSSISSSNSRNNLVQLQQHQAATASHSGAATTAVDGNFVIVNYAGHHLNPHLIDSAQLSTPSASAATTVVVSADPDNNKPLTNSVLGPLQHCHVLGNGVVVAAQQQKTTQQGLRTAVEHVADTISKLSTTNNNTLVANSKVVTSSNNSNNATSLGPVAIVLDRSQITSFSSLLPQQQQQQQSTIYSSVPSSSSFLLCSDVSKSTTSGECDGGSSHNGAVSVVGLAVDGGHIDTSFPLRINTGNQQSLNSIINNQVSGSSSTVISNKNNRIVHVNLGGTTVGLHPHQDSHLSESSQPPPLSSPPPSDLDDLSTNQRAPFVVESTNDQLDANNTVIVRTVLVDRDDDNTSEEELSQDSASEGMHSGRSGPASGQGYSNQQQQHQHQQQSSFVNNINSGSYSSANSSSNENSPNTSVVTASGSRNQTAMLSAGQPAMPAGLFRTGVADNSSSSAHRLSGVVGSAAAGGFMPAAQYSTIYGAGVPGQPSAGGHVSSLQPYSLFPQFAAASGGGGVGVCGVTTAPAAAGPPHGFSHSAALIGASPTRQYPHVESYSAILASMGSHALRGAPSSERSPGVQSPARPAPFLMPVSASQFPSIPPSSLASPGGASASSSSSLSSSHRRLSGSSSPSPGLASSAHGAASRVAASSLDHPPSSLHIEKMAEMKDSRPGADVHFYEGSSIHPDGSTKVSQSPRGGINAAGAQYTASASIGHHTPKVSFDSVVREYGGGRDSPTGGRDPRDPSFYRPTLSGKEGSLKHRILTRPSDSDLPEDLAKAAVHSSLKDEPVSKRAKFASVGGSSSSSGIRYGSPNEYEEDHHGRHPHHHHQQQQHPHLSSSSGHANNTNNSLSRSSKGAVGLSYSHLSNNGNNNKNSSSSNNTGSQQQHPRSHHHHPHHHSHHQHQSSLPLSSSTSSSPSSYSASQHQQHQQASGNSGGSSNNNNNNNSNTNDNNNPGTTNNNNGSQYSKPYRHSSSSSSSSPPAPPPPPPPPANRQPEDGTPSPSSPSSSSSHLQYPHHFMRGSIIQLANGALKRVEDLQTDDFVSSAEISSDLKVDSSTVVRIEEHADKGTAMLSFSVGEHRVQVTVEATLEHPFFVFGQGWSSCSVSRTLARYGLDCQKLSVGDVCISLTHKDVNMKAAEISQHQQQQQRYEHRQRHQSGDGDSADVSRGHDLHLPPPPAPVGGISSQRSTVSPSSSSLMSPPSQPPALSQPHHHHSASVTSTSPARSSPGVKVELTADGQLSSLSGSAAKRRLSQSELPPPSSTVMPVKKESSWHHHQHHRRRGSQNGGEDQQDAIKDEKPPVVIAGTTTKKEETDGGNSISESSDSPSASSSSSSRKRPWPSPSSSSPSSSSSPNSSILKTDSDQERDRQKRTGGGEGQQKEERKSPSHIDSK